jgi:hypothetical protein
MELMIARVRILSPEQGKLFLLPAEHRVTSLSRVTSPYYLLSKESSSYCMRSMEYGVASLSKVTSPYCLLSKKFSS